MKCGKDLLSGINVCDRCEAEVKMGALSRLSEAIYHFNCRIKNDRQVYSGLCSKLFNSPIVLSLRTSPIGIWTDKNINNGLIGIQLRATKNLKTKAWGLVLVSILLIYYTSRPVFEINTEAGKIELKELPETHEVGIFLNGNALVTYADTPHESMELDKAYTVNGDILFGAWVTCDNCEFKYGYLLYKIDRKSKSVIELGGDASKLKSVDFKINKKDGEFRLPVTDTDKVGYRLLSYENGVLKTYSDWKWKDSNKQLASEQENQRRRNNEKARNRALENEDVRCQILKERISENVCKKDPGCMANLFQFGCSTYW
jgi:hypothetical protein